MSIAVAIVVLGLLIFVHELGHFLAAKRAGIRVEEFALGFGPKTVSKVVGETEYSIRMLPLGGFVRVAGTNPEEASFHTDPRGYNRKPLRSRAGFIAAGPAMNFATSIVLFFVLFSVLGLPTPTLVIGSVLPGLAGDEAGLREGDQILSINDRPVTSWDEIVGIIQKSPGQELVFTVRRAGRVERVRVVPRENPHDPSLGYVGIGPQTAVRRQGILAGIVSSIRATAAVCVLWIKGIILMLLQKIEPDVAGPVGITQLIGEATRTGIRNLVYLTAALSANLGILNLLPIPALDGSRLVFLGIEAVRGKPVDPDKENLIHLVGFAFLIVLGLVVTYRDLLRLGQM